MPPIRREPMSPQKALERLESMCMRSEHCTGELQVKLLNWGLSSTDAAKIIERLVETRFVDDRRFARAFVRDKILLAHWGRYKVRQSLYTKHVDRDIIAEAIGGIGDDDYYLILYNLLKSKTTGHPELLDDIKGRTRLFRFAAARGFEPAFITRAVKELMSQNH